eukprot:2356366-Amphidinium_carterae.1
MQSERGRERPFAEEQRRAALQRLQSEQARAPPVDLFGDGPAEQPMEREQAMEAAEAQPVAASMLNARSQAYDH